MTTEIYDNLSQAKDKLIELQTAVEAVTYGSNVLNREVKLAHLLTELGQFTGHLESIVGCVDDSLDELDRLNQENSNLQKEIQWLQSRIIEREG